MGNFLRYACSALPIISLMAPPLAGAQSVRVTASEYGDKWPFTVVEGELYCDTNAVVMVTANGTYSINGKAMSRYEGRFPTFRSIAKPYSGINDPQAKMSPPRDLIRRGLKLCN
jgi:hypothetical protein